MVGFFGVISGVSFWSRKFLKKKTKRYGIKDSEEHDRINDDEKLSIICTDIISDIFVLIY